MKLTAKLFGLFLIAAFLVLSSCKKDEQYLGEIETVAPVASFTANPTAANPNYIVLENTSIGDGIFSAWRYRAGSNFQRDNDSMEADTTYYPDAGEYEVTLLVGNDAGQDSITMTIVIDQRDPDLPDEEDGNGCLTLGDFEDGEVGGWNSWGQDVTVVDNPAPSAINSSAKVLKMTQTEAFSQNANLTGPVVTPNALKITVDVYFEVAGSLKLQIEGDFATGYFLDVPAGEWVTLEYDLEGQVIEGGDYPWVLIQGNTPGSFFIDNIDYCATDIASSGDCALLGDFEDGEVGDWNAWGQNITVVDNPSPSAVNSSAFVLKATQTDPFAENANRSIPVVTENAKSVVLDVYFEVAGSLKLQIEGDFDTGFFQDVAAGEWVTLTYDLEGQTVAGGDYPWILIQGNTAGSYYLDNIEYCE